MTDSYCASYGHPAVTYNPWEDLSWCRCGTRTYLGKPATVSEHLACCGGPLT